MSRLLGAYKATLKPLAVEEPIDVFWHRLAGYAIARASFPTPVSADALTVLAILIGVSAGAEIALGHMLAAAIVLEISAMFDCADGQLARMRKESSEFGRMLDGVSDSIVMAATFLGTMIHFARVGAHTRVWWMIFLAAIAAPTCSFHFAWYDHYKNVYLRMTGSSFREGEDPASARARYAAFEGRTIILRFVWWVYLRYVSGQAWLLRWSDPYSRWDRAPIDDPSALGPMRLWRSLYGLGTHIFLFSLACAFDRIDVYLIFRVGALNLFALIVLIPWQRRVSRRCFP